MNLKALMLGTLFLLAIGLQAQIRQRLEEVDSLTVGARFKLIVEADFAINRLIVPDSLTQFEVIDSYRNTKDNPVPFMELTIIPLRTGALTFPSLEVQPVIPDSRRYYTDRFRINVLSVRAEGDDQLRDIKPPKRYPWQKPWWAYLIAAGMAFAAGLWQLKRVLDSRAKPVRVANVEASQAKPITLAPWELALQRLDRLVEKGLPEDGDQTGFHYRLAQILRAFLEQVYRFPALEMTSSEISRAIHKLELTQQREIRHFLLACDLIKFAKQQASLEEIRDRVEWFRAYLTRQDPLYHTVTVAESGKASEQHREEGDVSLR